MLAGTVCEPLFQKPLGGRGCRGLARGAYRKLHLKFSNDCTVFVVPVRERLVLPEVHPLREEGMLQEEAESCDVEVVLMGIERLPLDVALLRRRRVSATLTLSLLSTTVYINS